MRDKWEYIGIIHSVYICPVHLFGTRPLKQSEPTRALPLWRWATLLSRGCVCPCTTRQPPPRAGPSETLGWTMAQQSPSYHQSSALACALCRSGRFNTSAITWAQGTHTIRHPRKRQPRAAASLTRRDGTAPPPLPSLPGPAGPATCIVLIARAAGTPPKEKRVRDRPGHSWWPPAPGGGAPAVGSRGHGLPCLIPKSLPPVPLPHIKNPPILFRRQSI